jgi:hypothetical protein
MPEATIPTAFLTPAWWRQLVRHIEADAEIAHVGRWSNVQLALVSDSTVGIVTFEAGRVVAIADDIGTIAADAVVMTGSSRAWRAFLQPVPPPQHNDVLAMDRRQADFEISGARAVLIRNLRFIELVMARCRDVEVLG